jgi:hypothetical protein
LIGEQSCHRLFDQADSSGSVGVSSHF